MAGTNSKVSVWHDGKVQKFPQDPTHQKEDLRFCEVLLLFPCNFSEYPLQFVSCNALRGEQ